jgi:hypothetical protein
MGGIYFAVLATLPLDRMQRLIHISFINKGDTQMTTFTAAYDAGFQTWIVISTETKAASFAMVPVGESWEFSSKSEALEQATILSSKPVRTRMIETPDRFEAIADIKYGAAW